MWKSVLRGIINLIIHIFDVRGNTDIIKEIPSRIDHKNCFQTCYFYLTQKQPFLFFPNINTSSASSFSTRSKFKDHRSRSWQNNSLAHIRMHEYILNEITVWTPVRCFPPVLAAFLSGLHKTSLPNAGVQST